MSVYDGIFNKWCTVCQIEDVAYAMLLRWDLSLLLRKSILLLKLPLLDRQQNRLLKTYT